MSHTNFTRVCLRLLLLAGLVTAGFYSIVYTMENLAQPGQGPVQLEEALSQEPAVNPESVLAPILEPGTEAPPAVARPVWLEKAEKRFADGVKARDEGNTALASKNFRAALKILSRKADQAEIADLKDEIEAIFGKLEERRVPAPPAEAPPQESLEVTEEELEEAPVDGSTVTMQALSYAIPINPEDPLVKKYIALYTGKYRNRMQSALDRMQIYKSTIKKHIKESGLPRELMYLPIAESEYKNTATSHAGAVGLWQFMSGTGRRYGLKVNYWLDERRDPEKATRAALQYLKELHAWFDDWHLALASYNRGEFGIQRDLEFTRSLDYANLSQRRALPLETEHYVPKFMACVLIADNAASYGFEIKEAPAAAVDAVSLEKPMDLRIAADCAGITEAELRELNPTLRLWCTPKDSAGFALKIPAGTKERFLAKAETVKNWTPDAGVVKYRVQRGDFLGKIAKRYRTSVQNIQRDNRIQNPKALRPGQVLVIRPGKQYQGD